MFIDEARIWVKAGDGGKGCAPFGGRSTCQGRSSGGDGGDGGNVILESSEHLNTLLPFRYNREFKASAAATARARTATGDRRRQVIRVPVGTVVSRKKAGETFDFAPGSASRPREAGAAAAMRASLLPPTVPRAAPSRARRAKSAGCGWS
jgi:GTP-binding protein